jgi:hypothetical protein
MQSSFKFIIIIKEGTRGQYLILKRASNKFFLNRCMNEVDFIHFITINQLKYEQQNEYEVFFDKLGLQLESMHSAHEPRLM